MIVKIIALAIQLNAILILSTSAQLIVDGKSEYTIYSSPAATETERYAAQELQQYLHEISGVQLPITQEPQPKTIYVGFQGAPKALSNGLTPTEFGKEEYIIREQNGALLIAGGEPRGTLYGTIGFLQDHLGCRWYSKDVITTPKQTTISIKGLNDRQAPAFEYREPWYREAYDTEFALHNRLNPSGVPLPMSKGGSFIMYPFVHTFNNLVPIEQYHEENPEYFALVDGVRTDKHFGGQLCLTNPDVLRIATETVMQWIKDHPEADVFSIDQNDGFGFCECEPCAAIDKSEGSQSGTVLHFVNQIADVVAKKHPDIQLQTLAYVYSEVPPKTMKPRPNVTIRMCHYDYCNAHAIGQCPDHQRFVTRLEGWSAITDSITIWDYYTDFRHYLIPYPNFESMINHPRFYAERNCTGLFAQGSNVRQQGGGEFSALRAWVFAQLMWNPHQDGWALVHEFVDAVYGPSAPYIRDYIALAHNAVKGEENLFRIFTDPTTMKFLTPEFIHASEALFIKAEAAAQNNPDLLKRVELAHLPIHYARLYFYTVGGTSYLSKEEMPKVLDSFMRITAEHKIKQLAERGGPTVIADFTQKVKEAPEFVTDWWIVGPFGNKDRIGFDHVYLPEQRFEPDRFFEGIDYELISWRPYKNERTGYIDFAALIQPNEEAVAYAYRRFDLEEAAEIEIGLGSNDGFKLWLNGNIILSKKTSRVAEPNQELITLPMRKGPNEVLIKIEQLGGGWGFYFTKR